MQIGAVVPSMLQMLLAQPLEDHDLSALRRIACGAAPLLARDPRASSAAGCRGVELAEGYGCTETRRADLDLAAGRDPAGQRGQAGAGRRGADRDSPTAATARWARTARSASAGRT